MKVLYLRNVALATVASRVARNTLQASSIVMRGSASGVGAMGCGLGVPVQESDLDVRVRDPVCLIPIGGAGRLARELAGKCPRDVDRAVAALPAPPALPTGRGENLPGGRLTLKAMATVDLQPPACLGCSCLARYCTLEPTNFRKLLILK